MLLLIIIIQGISFYINSALPDAEPPLIPDTELQVLLDSLQRQEKSRQKDTIYPFNPNYLTDFKGYRLGLSPLEIDRLSQYRATGGFVNNPREFQAVTKISDSKLAVIAPYFKFPEWVARKKKNTVKAVKRHSSGKTKTIKKDLNSAGSEELRSISGVGPYYQPVSLNSETAWVGFS